MYASDKKIKEGFISEIPLIINDKIPISQEELWNIGWKAGVDYIKFSKRKQTKLKLYITKEEKFITKKINALYRKLLREELFQIYGDTCSCCGEFNQRLLTLDHINNDGNLERKEKPTIKIYKDAIENINLNKYQILCYNCNMGKYLNKGICPHIK
jgi:hypothetical protein